MRNSDEIKRKHFRFPAYSDETGVKIQREQKKPLFSAHEPWILTEETGTPFYTKKETIQDTKELRRSTRTGQNKAGHSIQQREELKRHRTNLPDYTKRSKVEVTKTGKKQLFGETVSQASYLVKEKKSEVVPSVKRAYSGRSYFVPKYIPASIIPDETQSTISEAELLDSMRKPQDSYLLFDSERTPYQERKDDEPSVKKFPATTELLKESEPKKSKKRMSLNRSLDGMIAKETNDVTEKNYFR
ncbi:hypothetical protein ACYSNO_02245 [Enterococcus sp. LJL98]